MNRLQARIGYTFKKQGLLVEALTHRSLANVRKIPSNERLEFLGDSVIRLVLAAEAFRLAPHFPEGKLHNVCTTYSNNQALAGMARELGLEHELRFESTSVSAPTNNMLADAFEALVGAVFEDAGYEATRRVLLELYNFEEGRSDEQVSLGTA
jgi:dsRNA-specific ribonuclease